METKDIQKENLKEDTNEKKNEGKKKDAKQEFLRKELIDKGYNPEDFSNYVSGAKGFTTEEIGLDAFKILVAQFKTEQLKKASEVVKEEIKENDIILY